MNDKTCNECKKNNALDLVKRIPQKAYTYTFIFISVLGLLITLFNLTTLKINFVNQAADSHVEYSELVRSDTSAISYYKVLINSFIDSDNLQEDIDEFYTERQEIAMNDNFDEVYRLDIYNMLSKITYVYDATQGLKINYFDLITQTIVVLLLQLVPILIFIYRKNHHRLNGLFTTGFLLGLFLPIITYDFLDYHIYFGYGLYIYLFLMVFGLVMNNIEYIINLIFGKRLVCRVLPFIILFLALFLINEPFSRVYHRVNIEYEEAYITGTELIDFIDLDEETTIPGNYLRTLTDFIDDTAFVSYPNFEAVYNNYEYGLYYLYSDFDNITLLRTLSFLILASVVMLLTIIFNELLFKNVTFSAVLSFLLLLFGILSVFILVYTHSKFNEDFGYITIKLAYGLIVYVITIALLSTMNYLRLRGRNYGL